MPIDCPRIFAANYASTTNVSQVSHNGFKLTSTDAGFGTLQIDSVNVALGEWVLLTGQTDKVQNGLWQLTQLANVGMCIPWQMCRNHPGGKLFIDMLYYIKGGDTMNCSLWCLSVAKEGNPLLDVDIITAGISELTFAQLSIAIPEGKGCDAITSLTNSTGATADDTVADVSTVVTGVDGTGSNAASKADVDTRLSDINDNFSDLSDKVNEILDCLREINVLNVAV